MNAVNAHKRMDSKSRYDDLGYPWHVKQQKLLKVNLVVTFDTNTKQPTDAVVRANPLKFGHDLQSVSCNMAFPQVKISMYPSGKGLLVGARNLMQCLYAIKVFMFELQKCGVRAVAEDLRVKNVTATVKITTGKFDIAALDKDFKDKNSGTVEFNLTMFPGARFQFGKGLCCTIFATGTQNFTGSNKVKDIEDGFRCFNEVKERYLVLKSQEAEFKQKLEDLKREHAMQNKKKTKRIKLA